MYSNGVKSISPVGIAGWPVASSASIDARMVRLIACRSGAQSSGVTYAAVMPPSTISEAPVMY